MLQGIVSNVRDTVNQAVSQASAAVQDVTKMGEKALTGDLDYFKDRIDVGEMFNKGKELFSDTKEFFQTNNSFGKVVGHGLDKIGLPEWASSFAGGAIDLATMNPRGYEQIMMGISHGAAELGMEDFSAFMATASDVTSMATTIGQGVALTVATGGAGAPGLLAQAGQLGQLGQVVATGVKIAGHVETALNVVDAFQSGDHGKALTGILGAVVGNTDVLGDALGFLGDGQLGDILGSVFGDGQLGDILGGVFGDGGDILSQLFSQAEGGHLLEMGMEAILDAMNINTGDWGGLSGPIVDAGRELLGMAGKELDFPGSEFFSSPGGEALLRGLTDLLTGQLGQAMGSSEISVEALVSEAGAMTAGMIDVANLDKDVALMLMNILMQMGSVNQSSAVSDMIGAFVRG